MQTKPAVLILNNLLTESKGLFKKIIVKIILLQGRQNGLDRFRLQFHRGINGSVKLFECFFVLLFQAVGTAFQLAMNEEQDYRNPDNLRYGIANFVL